MGQLSISLCIKEHNKQNAFTVAYRISFYNISLKICFNKNFGMVKSIKALAGFEHFMTYSFGVNATEAVGKQFRDRKKL